MSPTRVVLIDDHSVVTDGVAAVLARFEDIDVVGTAHCGRDGAELCERLEPDVVLMDMSMPEMSGVEATERILVTHPEIRILALTGFVDEDMVRQALAAGASGYLLKTATGEDLADAIRRVAKGQAILSVEALRHAGSAGTNDHPGDSLTPRERDVLADLSTGMTNKEIAHELSLSAGTVRIYVSTILAKLGVDNRTAAAGYALRHRLVPEAPGG